MSQARLKSITIENMKSFRDKTRIPFAPLTIVVGRNNSGKSTLIQSLLLLKQTLSDPRSYLPLKLDGVVEAFHLRELTHGWPEAGDAVTGPTIALEWESRVDVEAALNKARNPDRVHLATYSGVPWLENLPDTLFTTSELRIHTLDANGTALLAGLEIEIRERRHRDPLLLRILPDGDAWYCEWLGQQSSRIQVELDHFIPYLRIDRSRVGPRLAERAWHNAYLIIFEQPLEHLKQIIKYLFYLGSHRSAPQGMYRPATTDPMEIGISGEFAAQMLHRKQSEIVHFLLPDRIASQDGWSVSGRPMGEAINAIMRALAIDAPLQVKEVMGMGFQLMFGNANLVHVGRGLGYLLPVIVLGLFADPLRFVNKLSNVSLRHYNRQCETISHILMEEPEAHLHPKAASRLADYFVSLAMANRQLLIETHSDHLVRRLRGLAARAPSGSPLEKWLLKNVVVLSVSQDEQGCSCVEESRLTADGWLGDHWPAEFMDEASDAEDEIYNAKLDKVGGFIGAGPGVTMVEGEEPEEEAVP
ncbi:MAG: AAA family ATPase [Magnetococcales bacterium]|nr:AAA family ATPase [Magnetococcales bacterium]